MFNFLKNLFVSDDQPISSEPTTEYKGFHITPRPRRVEGGFGVGATISLDTDSGKKVHDFIRADSMGSRDACIEVTLNKAKMTIDQMGERLFR